MGCVGSTARRHGGRQVACWELYPLVAGCPYRFICCTMAKQFQLFVTQSRHLVFCLRICSDGICTSGSWMCAHSHMQRRGQSMM